jgi:hypothetical protein
MELERRSRLPPLRGSSLSADVRRNFQSIPRIAWSPVRLQPMSSLTLGEVTIVPRQLIISMCEDRRCRNHTGGG